jgi:hypothetical protein
MAIICASCGMENADAADLCDRCRAPLVAQAGATWDVGQLCGRCESYNEPGVERCTTCGYRLESNRVTTPSPAEAQTAESAGPTMTQELRAVAISAEEAAAAGIDPLDDISPSPEPPSPPAGSFPSTKPCASCGAENPGVARFCFDCGTPFGTAAPPASPPPELARAEDETQAPESWSSSTDPTAWAAPELGVGGNHALSAEELGAEAPDDSPGPADIPPPFPASLVVERGSAPGTAYALERIENILGGSGAGIELAGDPHLAPRVASIAFVEERLVVRDEGSANGVYLKLRDESALAPGDFFIAGERLLRYDGPSDLPAETTNGTPCLGSPRPQGTVVRVSEVLRGGRTGRTCYRTGPIIAVGRSGCDLNFPADSQLAARHAEVRIGEDGSVTLVDVGASPSGVFVRVRAQEERELSAGDVLQIGDHILRVEIG